MKRRENKSAGGLLSRLGKWLWREKWGALVLLLALAAVIGLRLWLRQAQNAPSTLLGQTGDLAAAPTVTDDMALLDVTDEQGTFTFACGGKYLTAGETEDALYFADRRTDRAEWTVDPLGDGTFVLKSAAAGIDGAPLAVCHIGGFTAYPYQEGASSFPMQFWFADDAGNLAPLDQPPQDGDRVVLYYPARTVYLTPNAPDEAKVGDYAEYEKGIVLAVTADTSAPDETADGAYRGQQTLTVEIRSGRYKGRTLENVYNYVGPVSSVPVKAGDGVALIVSTYQDGSLRASVYEYDRIPALVIVLLLFFLVTALVGGKTGVKSLVSLALTVLVLFTVLIPLLLRGFPTLPTVFVAAAFIAVVTFVILGGLHRKSVCAMLGAVAGTVIALGFGLLAQAMARVNGLRIADVEALLQLRQTGTPIGLKGLLVGGVVISALGAVMDVAMSISSALEEVHAANPERGVRELFRSGMNIGRDMVGTMTNTLILAFLGAGFTLIIYLYSLGLQPFQLYPSAYVAIELISGVASSVGMILAIPLTAIISALLLKGRK